MTLEVMGQKMSDFKVGDEVWFFYTDCGRYVYPDISLIFTNHIEIQTGNIVAINPDKDYVHVYVNGDTNLYNFGYCFHKEYFFKSKQECIDAFKKRLDEL